MRGRGGRREGAFLEFYGAYVRTSSERKSEGGSMREGAGRERAGGNVSEGGRGMEGGEGRAFGHLMKGRGGKE